MTIFSLRYSQPEVGVPSENWMKSQLHRPKGGIIVSQRMKMWKEAGYYCWKKERFTNNAEVLGQPCLVVVELGFHTNRRRDPHNYIGTVCKSLIDGLVLAGLWPDDNPEWITVREPILTVHDRVPKDNVLPFAVHLKPRKEQ